MAHPMNNVRAHKVEHARVKDITAACGGGMSTGGSATGLIAKQQRMLGKVPQRADGGAVKARSDRPGRAWGGRTGKTGKKKSGAKHTVNVIVAPHAPAPAGGPPPMPHPMVPGVAASPPPGGPPPAGGPPPMPHPMMPPGPGGAPMAGPGGPALPGAGPLPPGVPPPGIRYNGGRAFKKGGAVSSANAGIGKGRTPIERSFPSNKQDTPNIGRGAVVTKATGGPITSEKAAKMGPKFMGGGMGGIAKLQKMERAVKSGYGAPTRTAKNPTQDPKC